MHPKPHQSLGFHSSDTLETQAILYEKSLNLKTISQGDFGHFENNQIILSKVAKLP